MFSIDLLFPPFGLSKHDYYSMKDNERKKMSQVN